MTALPRSYDTWRLRGPHDDEPDYSAMPPIEVDGADVAFGWLQITLLYDCDGRLDEVKIGQRTETPYWLRDAIGEEGFKRFAQLDADTLAEARQGYDASEMEARYDRD